MLLEEMSFNRYTYGLATVRFFLQFSARILCSFAFVFFAYMMRRYGTMRDRVPNVFHCCVSAYMLHCTSLFPARGLVVDW